MLDAVICYALHQEPSPSICSLVLSLTCMCVVQCVRVRVLLDLCTMNFNTSDDVDSINIDADYLFICVSGRACAAGVYMPGFSTYKVHRFHVDFCLMSSRQRLCCLCPLSDFEAMSPHVARRRPVLRGNRHCCCRRRRVIY